ncbi:putative integral membrane protein [Aspergillus ellipticus CBS 707.79]|uniref:Putative integral membrane protein n=1 Tax=Aspergillus ellipticus CBS 707.79 TaxID=1448320 RepID=A0A319CRN0_9EURO|nr:putative integral membrane protein [Aspergillus ellipticus CBS 707.79]
MTAIFPIKTQPQRELLGMSITFSVLTFVAVVLRLLAHHIARKKWTASDYFIIAACMFAIGVQTINIIGVIQTGIGFGHTKTVEAIYGSAPIVELSKIEMPLQPLWVLSLACSKVSILLLYFRIFPVPWVLRSSQITIVIIICWAIATTLAAFLNCRPFAFNWDRSIPGGKCGDRVKSFTVMGVINLVTDLVVLVIPMPLLYRLQMAQYKKVTLMIVFGLGAVTCVISALRIAILASTDYSDLTYSLTPFSILSGLEPCLAVILACVPLMRPLLKRWVTSPNATGRTRTTSRSAAPKPPSGDVFQELEDNTSQVSLRPLGVKNPVGVTSTGNVSCESDESLETRLVNQRQNPEGGIRVRQEWTVVEESRRG